jgi:hypothetical protein
MNATTEPLSAARRKAVPAAVREPARSCSYEKTRGDVVGRCETLLCFVRGIPCTAPQTHKKTTEQPRNRNKQSPLPPARPRTAGISKKRADAGDGPRRLELIIAFSTVLRPCGRLPMIAGVSRLPWWLLGCWACLYYSRCGGYASVGVQRGERGCDKH